MKLTLGLLYIFNFFYTIAYYCYRDNHIDNMIYDMRDSQGKGEETQSFIHYYYDSINRPFAGFRLVFLILVYTPVLFLGLWLNVSSETFSSFAILYALASSLALYFLHKYEKNKFDALLKELEWNKLKTKLQKENQDLHLKIELMSNKI